MFVKEGTGIKEEIPTMPGQYRYSIDQLPYALEELVNRMEAGGMTLADTLKAYESGVKLSESLKKDLTAAQERLIILRGDKPEEGPEEA